MRLHLPIALASLLLAQEAAATFGSHTATPFASLGAIALDGTGVVQTRPDLCQSPRPLAINLEDFGAAGDGVTNDAPAIQAAVRSCAKPCTIQLEPGRWYRIAWGIGNAAVLHMDRPNVELRGNGTNGGIYVVLTDEQAQCSFTGGSPTGTPACAQTNGQAIHLAAPNTDLTDLSITSNIRYRSAGNPQGAAVWADSTEHDVCAVRTEYAPFHFRGASNYRIVGNALFRTYADPIHNTDRDASQTQRVGNGMVMYNHIAQSGDDGVAVIDRGVPNLSGYVISDNIIQDGYWGRGIGIDGGSDVTVARNTVLRQVMAGSIIAHADTPAFGAARTSKIVIRGNVIDGNQQGIEPPWHPCHSHFPGLPGGSNHWVIFQNCLTTTAGNPGWPIPITDHGAIDVLGRDDTGDGRPGLESRVSDLVIEGNRISNAVRGAFRVRDWVCGVRVKRNTLTAIGSTVWRESYTGVPGGKGPLDIECSGIGYRAGITECQRNTTDGVPMNCQ